MSAHPSATVSTATTALDSPLRPVGTPAATPALGTESSQLPSQFDLVHDRTGTGSLKWDFAAERGRPANALPLWVADMDHAAAPCVTSALL